MEPAKLGAMPLCMTKNATLFWVTSALLAGNILKHLRCQLCFLAYSPASMAQIGMAAQGKISWLLQQICFVRAHTIIRNVLAIPESFPDFCIKT